MKILHCCLSCFYIDHYNYQENVIPRINHQQGHEVMILASTETFIDNNTLGYLEPSEYLNEDGILVKRVAYKKYLPHKVMKKIRHYEDVYASISKFSPDVILFHGVPAYELNTITKYVKQHPHVKLFVDSHEDYNNSGTNFISLNVLHKLFYRNIIKKNLRYIEKVLYLSYETSVFLKEVYKIPESKLEYYPIGGTICSEDEKSANRIEIESLHAISEKDFLIIHSGKMDKLKKTIELIDAFKKIESEQVKLILIGSIPEDMSELILSSIKEDNRIQYLGWKKASELLKYLSGCDLYVQPGSQSATMQNAMCCGAPVVVYPHSSYTRLLGDSGIYVENTTDIFNQLTNLMTKNEYYINKKNEQQAIVKELLDYEKLSARIYK